MRGDLFEPRAGQLVDRCPGGEVEKLIRGVLRHVTQDKFGAFKRADAGQGTERLQADTGVTIFLQPGRKGTDIRVSAGTVGFPQFPQCDLHACVVGGVRLQHRQQMGRVTGAPAEQPCGVTSGDFILHPGLQGLLQLGHRHLREFATRLFKVPTVR